MIDWLSSEYFILVYSFFSIPFFCLPALACVVIPVHLTVDPQTGRLLGASVGTTSATPKHGWKELCQQAIDNNDLCHLLHCIQQRL